MLSRRAKLLFWTAIAAVLALGLGQVLVLSDAAQRRIRPRPSSSPNSRPATAANWPTRTATIRTGSSCTTAPRGPSTSKAGPSPTTPHSPTSGPFAPSPSTAASVSSSSPAARIAERSKPEEGRTSPHTNFRLDADGGFLGLYSPTSRRFLDASEYDYPAQHPGVTYGVLPGEPVRTGVHALLRPPHARRRKRRVRRLDRPARTRHSSPCPMASTRNPSKSHSPIPIRRPKSATPPTAASPSPTARSIPSLCSSTRPHPCAPPPSGPTRTARPSPRKLTFSWTAC